MQKKVKITITKTLLHCDNCEKPIEDFSGKWKTRAFQIKRSNNLFRTTWKIIN